MKYLEKRESHCKRKHEASGWGFGAAVETDWEASSPYGRVCAQVLSFQLQFPINAPLWQAVGDDASTHVTAVQVGDVYYVSGCWLWPATVLNAVGNMSADSISLSSLSVSPPHILSPLLSHILK